MIQLIKFVIGDARPRVACRGRRIDWFSQSSHRVRAILCMTVLEHTELESESEDMSCDVPQPV